MKIQFNINYPTEWGQELLVAGSSAELGQWSPDRFVAMTYHDGDEWKAEIELADPSAAFEYKYVIKDASSGLVWEWGANRSVSFDDRKTVSLRDTWRSAADPDSLFLASAFTAAVFNRPKKKAPAPGPKTTVRIQIRAARIEPDHTLSVTGSIPALGKWSAAKAAPMDPADFPLWTLDLPLGGSDIPFDYTYVIKDKKGAVVYEEGRSRNFGGGTYKRKTHAPRQTRRKNDAADTLAVVTDGAIHYKANWRGAGIAIPVFSLRTKKSLGVGEFLDLKGLADWASGCGFRLIQLLPVNDTSATMMWWDSYPYANISVFALHPLYLNLEAAGTLPDAEAKELEAQKKTLNGHDHVHYEEVMALKMRLARTLFQAAKAKFLASAEFEAFFEENAFWMQPYAAFSALRDSYKTSDFSKWERYARVTDADIHSITAAGSAHYDTVAFYYFLQYHLHVQLLDAAAYAASKRIVLKGDIPIGIHKHSDSCWLQPELFNMDRSAGAPPDPFSEVGQNWGFPTYNWGAMAQDGYWWWRRRLRKMSEYFGMIRLDHVLGFFRIWEIPDDMLSGLMGRFNPAIPLSQEELEREGIRDFTRMIEPYLPRWLARIIFGQETNTILSLYMEEASPGNYRLKSDFNTQAKVEKNIAAAADAPQDEKQKLEVIKRGLSYLISNVILFRDSEQAGFHPRINCMDTPSFDCLDTWMKEKLIHLYNDYFYRRQDGFWRGQAMTKLPVLKSASDMLICGEDLGMIPECVAPVMEELCILGLRIQRMPKETGVEFGKPASYPYMTVCTTSSHDMSTIRGWWGEDYARTQRYWKTILKKKGDAPSACESAIAEEILGQHLDSPSMWAVFPVQDILAMSETLRRPGDPREEQINDPANPHHYWKFRLHLQLEKLVADKDFSGKVMKMVADSGRCATY